MADYRLSVQLISRSAGRSAVAAAAYRAGELLTDERTGLEHDYARKAGVMHVEILAPEGAPAWAQDRSRLWNEAEAAETRINSQVARELQLSLPHELNHEQRAALVRNYVEENFVVRGMVADVAIHAPSRQGDQRNHHAHVMLTTREIGPEGFGKKQRDWNSRELIKDWRESWTQVQNQHLRQELGERAPQVTDKSFAERGLDRAPGLHLGPAATALERRKVASRRGDVHRDTRALNIEMKQIRTYQDRWEAQLETQTHNLSGVSSAMQRRHFDLTQERAEVTNQLLQVQTEMKQKRRYSVSYVERSVLGSYKKTEVEAKRELDQALQSSGSSVTPKEIMRWFTHPAEMFWQAAKVQMKQDLAHADASQLDQTKPNKASAKAWLRTEEGGAFRKSIIRNRLADVPGAYDASEKAGRASAQRQNSRRFLHSPAGQKKALETVRERQGNLSELRTQERKMRRQLARINRDLRVTTWVQQRSHVLYETGLAGSIQTSLHKPDPARYPEFLQQKLETKIQTLRPEQQQKLNQTLQKELTPGKLLTRALGRGR